MTHAPATLTTQDPTPATIDIGPGQLAAPSVPGGPAFALSTTDWIAIQTYVTDALALPTTVDTFRTFLGSGAPSDLSDFNDLVACWAGVNASCTGWRDSIFPASVSLASDVYDYGANKAPAFFPPILKLADQLTADPTDGQALTALKALLANLSADAQQRADKATAVKSQIQAFADATAASKTLLSGPPDNPGGLVKRYNDEYGTKSQDVIDLNNEIQAQNTLLKAANDEYNHDVVVAATTPSYGWVWPFGTIAAAVVAGIYGRRAVEALDRAKAARTTIDTLNAELASDALLMISLNSAETGIGNILGALDSALPVIKRIEGVWGGLADDLGHLQTTIENDITQALPVLMAIGVDETLRAWHNVALAADSYRLNAYVKVS